MKSVTLHTIAKEIATNKRDKSDIYIPDYILLGKEAVAEMNLRGFFPIQNVALDIDNTTHSAKLPEDYSKYIRVGICINGRILELDYDSTLCIREPQDNFCYTGGYSRTASVAFKSYKITMKRELPFTFSYTSDILYPNDETITIVFTAETQYVCSATVPLPTGTFTIDEYIIEEVGDCVGNGQTQITIDNTNIVANATDFQDDCGCLANNTIPQGYNSYYLWDGIYHNGNALKPVYTIPAYKSRGYFKIQNGRIYLNSVCSTGQVVLQYKSTGVSDSGQTQIPFNMKDIIKHYIVWKSAFFDKNTNIGQIKMYEEEFKRKKDLLVTQEVMSSILDMLKVQMKFTYQANLGRE